MFLWCYFLSRNYGNAPGTRVLSACVLLVSYWKDKSSSKIYSLTLFDWLIEPFKQNYDDHNDDNGDDDLTQSRYSPGFFTYLSLWPCVIFINWIAFFKTIKKGCTAKWVDIDFTNERRFCHLIHQKSLNSYLLKMHYKNKTFLSKWRSSQCVLKNKTICGIFVFPTWLTLFSLVWSNWTTPLRQPLRSITQSSSNNDCVTSPKNGCVMSPLPPAPPDSPQRYALMQFSLFLISIFLFSIYLFFLTFKMVLNEHHFHFAPRSGRWGGGGREGVLPKKLGRGVRPASKNPHPIYDQNLRFSLPALGPKSVIFPTLFMTWPKSKQQTVSYWSKTLIT